MIKYSTIGKTLTSRVSLKELPANDKYWLLQDLLRETEIVDRLVKENCLTAIKIIDEQLVKLLK